MTRRRLRVAQGVALALVVAALIVFGARDRSSEGTTTVIVYAAASLADVVGHLTDLWEARHPEVSVELVPGASSTLARQIQGGAAPDLFLSANTEWMDELERSGLVAVGTRREVLSNALVIVGPTEGPALSDVGALAGAGVTRLALADPEAVPAGRYARQALQALGLWEAVRGRLVIASDVRAALAYAERGEVEAAIVYRSDARVTERVRELVALPDAAQPDIRYAFARLRGSDSAVEADGLLAFLAGAEARAVFERYGFSWRDGELVAVGAAPISPSGASWAEDWAILRLSLLVAAVAVIICLPFGVATGWVLARKDFFGKSVVENVANLPLVLPPAVTGFLLLVVLGRQGPLGGLLDELFGVRIAFTWVAAALAAAAVSFPLMVQSVRSACEAVDPELEAAARTLGAGPWRVARTITLPLAAPGIVAGVVIAFARALGELGATLVFAGNTPGQTQTIPLAVWARVSQVGGETTALRLVVLSVVVSYVSLFAASRLHQRTLQRRWGP